MKIAVKNPQKTSTEINQMYEDTNLNVPSINDEDLEYMSEEDKKLINLQQTLANLYGTEAPTISQLEAWKKRHDNIYISHISNSSKDVYIWRILRRHEFKQMKEGQIQDQESFNEMMVETCLLFPTYDFNFRQRSAAGTITTLGSQISYKSGFVGEQEALNLIFIS